MSETGDFKPDRTEPLLIVISGPSGAGKDSVILRMKERGLNFHFVVTATTRPKRENERHGVDYLFYTRSEFAEMIDRDELLEYAIVYEDYKGIPRTQVRDALDSGQDVIMRVDVQGAATIREKAPEAVLIFLTTVSEDALVRRLVERRTDPPDQLKLRIAMARQEMKRIEEFDYVVVNHDSRLDETVDVIAAIIQAEHHKVHHRKVQL